MIIFLLWPMIVMLHNQRQGVGRKPSPMCRNIAYTLDLVSDNPFSNGVHLYEAFFVMFSFGRKPASICAH